MIIFAADGRACHTAQEANLADMRERICDRALKNSLRRFNQRRIRFEIIVESLKRRIEARDPLVPRDRWGIVPFLLALREGERPVEQISQMGENLSRCARCFARAEISEPGGHTGQRFSCAIG